SLTSRLLPIPAAAATSMLHAGMSTGQGIDAAMADAMSRRGLGSTARGKGAGGTSAIAMGDSHLAGPAAGPFPLAASTPWGLLAPYPCPARFFAAADQSPPWLSRA